MKRSFLPRLLEWLCIVALACLPILWLAPGEVATGGDTIFPLNPIGWLRYRTSLWDYRVNAGSPAAVHATTLPFHAVQAAWAYWGLSLTWVQRLSYCFWMLGILLAGRALLCVTLPKSVGPWGRWIGLGILAFNPFLFNTWEGGKVSILSAFVLLPVLLTCLVGMILKRWPLGPSLGAVALVSVLAGGVGVDPPIVGVLVLAVLVSASILGWPSGVSESVSMRSLLRAWGLGLVTLAVFFVVSAFWLLPYGRELMLQSLSSSQIGLESFGMADWLKGISTQTSLLNVARLQGTWDWYYTHNAEPYSAYAAAYFSNPWLILLSLLWPILAYGALVTSCDRITVLFVFLAMVGTVFGAGAHPPFGNLFLWCVDHLPGFFIFRSPYYKFGILLPVAYAVLVPRAWMGFSCRLKDRWMRRLPVGPISAIGLLLANALYAFPLWTGKIIYTHERLPSIRLRIPEHVFQAAEWFSKIPQPGRILSLPQETADNYRWGYGSLAHILTLLCDRPVVHDALGSHGPVDRLRRFAYETLYMSKTPFLGPILDLLGVRYLLLRQDSWFDLSGDRDDPDWVEARIKEAKDIDPKVSFGPWKIYESLTSSHPPIKIVSQVTLVVGGWDALWPFSFLKGKYWDTAFAFVDGESPLDPIRSLLQKGEGVRLLFHEATPLDLALEWAANRRDGVAQISQGTWILSIPSSSLYDVWLSADEPTPEGILVNGQTLLIPTGIPRLAGLDAKRWVRFCPAIVLEKGTHRFQALNWQSGTSLPKLLAVPSNDWVHWVAELKEQIANLKTPLLISAHGTIQPMDSFRTDAGESLLSATAVDLSPPRSIDPFGEGWQWISTQGGYRLINKAPQPIRTHLFFEVLAPVADRSLYIYLDRQLLQVKKIGALRPTVIRLNDVTLTPGEHELTLYVLEGNVTLFERDPSDAAFYVRQASVAIRHLTLGSGSVAFSFFIPRAGLYRLKMYGHPILFEESPQVTTSDGRSIPMAKDQGSDGGWIAREPIRLKEGKTEIHLSGGKALEYYAILEEVFSSEEPGDAHRLHVDLKHRSPTEYLVEVNSTQTGPHFLVTQDAFHPDWQAWLRRSDQKKQHLQDRHFQANGYANAWYLPLEEGYSVIQIAYLPQHLFGLAIAITLAALVLVVGWGAVGWMVNRWRLKEKEERP